MGHRKENELTRSAPNQPHRAFRQRLLLGAAAAMMFVLVPAVAAAAMLLPNNWRPRANVVPLPSKPQSMILYHVPGARIMHPPNPARIGDSWHPRAGVVPLTIKPQSLVLHNDFRPRVVHPPPSPPLNGDSDKVKVAVAKGGDHPGGVVWNRPPPPPLPVVIPPPRVVVIAPPPPVVIQSPRPAVNPSSQPSIIQPPPPSLATAVQPVRHGGGVPPVSERRYVTDEVLIEVATTTTVQQTNALARRHRLALLREVPFQLGGTTLQLWRITDGRAVSQVVRALESDGSVLSAQPNYLYALIGQETGAAAPNEGDSPQYVLGKMHLREAHEIAKGDKVLVAVIDTGIDTEHPELDGAIADSYDAIHAGLPVHFHGTAVAGAIAAHGLLAGAAPAARILAIRAFTGSRSHDGESAAIADGLTWAVLHGARIVNMSFTGPEDPVISRAMATAHLLGVSLVAAAGNKGARSGPLYPASNPNVIAVTATDENDQIPAFANRGKYVAVAAPGQDILLPVPKGLYDQASGTSFSAAYVTGTAALVLEMRPGLGPEELRVTLMATAHHLGSAADTQFGAGLVDAYKAVLAVAPAAVRSAQSSR